MSKTEDIKIGTLKIAKEVAELIVSPNEKQNWRTRISQISCPWPFTLPKEMLEEHEETRNGKKVKCYTKSKTWDGELKLREFDPQESIDALYTILAFCHDEHFSEHRIITEEIEANFPGLYIATCLYVSHMSNFDAKLWLYLKHVRQDLGCGAESKKVPWSDNDPNYLPLTKAIINFAGGEIPVSTLSKKIRPDGPIHLHYMRKKGKGCKVHIEEFKEYVRKEYPDDATTRKLAQEYLAKTEASKEREKSKWLTGLW